MLGYLIDTLGEFDNFKYIWGLLTAVYLLYAYLIRRKNKAIGNSVAYLIGILLVIGRLDIDRKIRRFTLIVVELIIIIIAHTILMKLKKDEVKNVKSDEKTNQIQ